MSKLKNKHAVMSYLTPREHANVAGRGALFGIEQSEVIALAVQLLMETDLATIRKRLRPTGRGGKLEPVREYDEQTGQLIWPDEGTDSEVSSLASDAVDAGGDGGGSGNKTALLTRRSNRGSRGPRRVTSPPTET